MNIRVIAAVHGRPAITRVFYEGVNRLHRELVDLGVNLSLSISFTDEPDLRLAEDVLDDNVPLTHIQAKNNPVGEKHNKAFELAMRDKWDALMIMDSDNLISTCGVSLLASEVGRLGYCGFESVYFHESHTKEFREFRYKGDRLIGCGRMISRKACEKISTRNNNRLWAPNLDRGLDKSSSANLFRIGLKQNVLDHPTCMMDIKSTHNITNFQLITFLSKQVNKDEAVWFLSKEERNLLDLLV